MTPDASLEDIRRAWKTLIQVWHPDRFAGQLRVEAEEMTKAINEAYEVLNGPSRRNSYDTGRPSAHQSEERTSEAAGHSGPATDASQIFIDAMLVLLTLVLATVAVYCAWKSFAQYKSFRLLIGYSVEGKGLWYLIGSALATLAGGALASIWAEEEATEDRPARPGRSAPSLIAVGMAVAVFLVIDWTFSFGPLSWNAVRYCTTSLTDQRDDATGETVSEDHARASCWESKRDGKLNLSGGRAQ